MKKFLLKLFGYNECNKCHKLFSQYGGNIVIVINVEHFHSDKINIGKRFFCHEHKVDFFLAINGLANNGDLYEETLIFRKMSKGSTNFYPELVEVQIKK